MSGDQRETGYDFKKDLAYSISPEHEPFWNNAYRRFFKDFDSCKHVGNDKYYQQKGVDRIVNLTTGKQFYVEEKCDSYKTNNIVFEFEVVDQPEKKGWIEKDCITDYLAYGYVNNQTCLIYPFNLLQRIWFTNKRDWINRYRTQEIKNNAKWAVNCCFVPYHVVNSYISQYCVINCMK